MNASLSICYKLWEKMFIFTINIPAKLKVIWGLIFRGKRPTRPTGAYFQRGPVFEGGLLFRVYSILPLGNKLFSDHKDFHLPCHKVTTHSPFVKL